MPLHRVGLWIFFTALIVAHVPVRAEWVALEARYQSHPLQTIYVDPESIQREGNHVTLSALIDWKAMQGGRSPTRFYSTTLTKQFDCEGMRVRTPAATDFYGHMGTGEIIGGNRHTSESHWIAVESDTLNQRLWEVACRQHEGP